MSNQHQTSDRKIQSVTELTSLIKNRIEREFSSVWVRGEISNLSRPQSGHYYFTLKDDNSQIRSVIWRSTAQRTKFELEEGQEVLCNGDIDLYLPRGSYQLIVRKVEPVGEGQLQLAFKQLHRKLSEEGLFDRSTKKAIPRYPQRIGIVTSPTGAAVRDFCQVVKRRWPQMAMLIIPSRVQGDEAPLDLCRAIKIAGRIRPALDLLLITRGGGSIEDLWCFNNEAVVRAIHSCSIPVVSAIGHEIDVTLSDLAADRRALTPTEAAEIISPDQREWLDALDEVEFRLAFLLKQQAKTARARLDRIVSRRIFQQPQDLLNEYSRDLDAVSDQLSRLIQNRITDASYKLQEASVRLQAINPLQVLARGYSITSDSSGRMIKSSEQLEIDDEMTTRMTWGEIKSRVTRVDNHND